MTLAWTPPLLGDLIDEVDAWNKALVLVGEILPLGEDGASFTFAPGEAPATAAWIAEVGFENTPERFLVQVRDFPFRDLFAVDLEAADLTNLPDGLRQALCEGMFTSICAQIVSARSERLELRRQALLGAFDDHATPEMQWLAVTINRSDGFAIHLAVGGRRAAFAKLLEDTLPAVTSMHSAFARKIKLPADTIIGSIDILPDDLPTLKPGAIVVLAQRPANRLTLCVQDYLFDFEPAQEGWYCLGQRPIAPDRARVTVHDNGDLMNKMSPSTEPDLSAFPEADAPDLLVTDAPAAVEAEPTGLPEAKAAVRLAGLRIGIDFDIGRCLVPIDELSQWSEGSVVVLDAPTPENGVPVTIRANGDVIGSGDVVRIDERIAVRITHFNLRA